MSVAAMSAPQYPDLPGFDKENRSLVYAMCDAGWTGRRTSKGHWLAKAPDGSTQITVPAKNGNNRGLKNASATFMRWMREHGTPEIKELWDKAHDEEDPMIRETLIESLVKKQVKQVVDEQKVREAEEFVEAVKTGRIVIEPLIRPWLARKHSGKDGGTRYESQTTLERVWPDGDTDYMCAFDGCDYTADRPRSVAQHFGQQHTRKGESDGAGEGPHHIDPEYTEPVTSREYRPTERMVETLMGVLDGILNETADMRETAVRLLTWMNDRPDIEHTERPLVPLSDRQTLDRIRLLVGQPDQTETIERLTRERDEANARLVKVERDIAGLRELLEGIGR